MLWKAASVQLKNVKARNAGSYFPASQILGSDALKQAWLSMPAKIVSYVHEESGIFVA